MLDISERDASARMDVVTGIHHGQRGAQLELAGAIAAPMRRTLYRLLGGQAPIEVLLEAALLRALSEVDSFDRRQPLVLWAQGIAVRIAASFLRGLRQQRPAPPPPDTEPTVRGLLDRVHARLSDLPPEDQIAFALLYIEGRPLEEAALLMRASPPALRRCAERAQHRLLFLARGDQRIAAYLRISRLLAEAARRFERVTLGYAPLDPVCARIASRLSEASLW